MDATTLARELIEPTTAHREIGVRVHQATDGAAVVTLAGSALPTNAVGAPHASALIALLDATGLAAVLSACPTEQEARRLVPLEVSATVDFRRQGRGRLLGHCTIGTDARAALRCLLDGESERARVGTLAEIQDGTGAVVCSGTVRWNVRLLPTTDPACHEAAPQQG
jgi:acyl-coenzyme A thioesterase PaaI-like protein